MKLEILPLALALFGLTACGEEPGASPGQEPGPGEVADAAPGHHGNSTDLGTLTVAGRQFGVVRFGDLVPGVEGAFEVRPKGAAAAELASLNLYLWVESEDGTQLSAPAKGSVDGGGLHFHVMPRKGDVVPHRVVLRLRADGTDERAGLPLDGHGHEHREGPHHGLQATFEGGEIKGHLELKLHDDKGDLELWLCEDPAYTRPFDLRLDASVEIEFVDLPDRKVSLRPRDQVRNEDEDGEANVRDGKTNYFIFPGTDDQDASWLQGAEFQSIVILRFTRDGAAFASEEFVLKPHVH